MKLGKKKQKAKKENHSLHIISAAAPFQYVEAYKSLRTNLNFMTVNGDYKKIVVTSSIPEEGKSNVAINLAVTLGETDKRVLLVDCDLRKPILHRYLKIKRRSQGLTSVLSGEATLEESVVSFSDLKIEVLVAGAVPPNPAEILGSKKMEALISEMEKIYDYIIFDTPPVSVVTDAAVLGRLTDGAVLVIRHKYVTIESVKLAKQNLESVGVNIIGTVLNRFDFKGVAKDNGYYYSYEYNYQHV